MARIRPEEYTGKLDAAAPDIGWGVGVGVWQILPSFQDDEYFNQLTYEMVSNGPTGRFEVTNAPIEDVQAEIETPLSKSNVVGFPWAAGLVTVPTQELSPPPTAFRVVATAGEIEYNARATA